MIDTLLLALSILVLFSFIIFTIVKPGRLSAQKITFVIAANLFIIILLVVNLGPDKLVADISRLVRNSHPKAPHEIYSVIFKMPKDDCVSILNIKDQLIPKIDCCIWMEIQICNSELEKILRSKKYETSVFYIGDTTLHLDSFDGRPDWWDLQFTGDSILISTIRLSERNRQTLFFGKDSSHVYICDQAL